MSIKQIPFLGIFSSNLTLVSSHNDKMESVLDLASGRTRPRWDAASAPPGSFSSDGYKTDTFF